MLAELIQVASLVIWDEAPMTNRCCFEALDRTMKDILSEHKPSNAMLPFGGNPVVLGGDFRQILPVVRKGSRAAVVGASITNSRLWRHVVLLKLHTNRHLRDPSLQGAQRDELQCFSEWILAVGDGTIHTERRGDEREPSWVTIPDDLLIHTEGDKIAALVSEVYPDLLRRYRDPSYLSSRAIVCPNNQRLMKSIATLSPCCLVML